MTDFGLVIRLTQQAAANEPAGIQCNIHVVRMSENRHPACLETVNAICLFMINARACAPMTAIEASGNV
jgi:hypothetical protein